MKNFRFLIFLITCYFSFVTSYAQKTYTLRQCVDQAIAANIEIERNRLNLQNAQLDLDLAKQARYPNLNGSASVGWNFGRSVDPTSNTFITETFFSNNYGVNSGVLLYNGSRLRNSIKKSEYDLQASEADMEQSQRDIAMNVALAYLNVLFSRENIAIAETQAKLNQQQLDQVNKLIRAGSVPAGDRLSVEALLSQSAQTIIVAENNYENAKLQLKQLMRIDANEDLAINVPQDIMATLDPDDYNYEDIYNAALKHRYDIVSAGLRGLSAEKSIDLARSGYFPSLSLFGNLATNYSNQAKELRGFDSTLESQEVMIDGIPITISQFVDRPILATPNFGSQLNEFISYGFGLGLNVPIYNQGITKTNVQRAELNLEAQNLAQEQIKETLRLTVQQDLANAKAAKRKLEASKKTLLSQQAALDNVNKKLEIGAANTFEWENQRSQLENAQLSLLIDKYDYIFKTKVLEFHLGKPLKI